jgi:hypothetical protein
MREVWACFIRAGGDHLACDAFHRAHMVLQVITDRRQTPARRDVLVREMDDVEKMDLWQGALSAFDSVKEKLAFVYNVLLEEARGDIG